MRRHAFPGVVFSLFFLFSASRCTSDLHSIEGRVFFKVYEGRQNSYLAGRPRIILEMRTEKIYGCCNNRIISEITRSGSYITVNLKGILVPEVCLTALGPAGSRDFLDLPEGVYSLNLLRWSSPDKYTLTVRKEAIEVVPGLTTWTAPDWTAFWRYPENSFAYYCGTMTETSWICDDFLVRLLGEIDLEEFRFPDYGQIPYSPSSQGHYYDAPARFFRYQTEDDFHKAGEILAAYSREVTSGREGTGLCLENWENKHYCSWLFQIP
jgi:hypothetical protein